MKYDYMRITELSEISGRSVSTISQYFKNHSNDQVTRINNRIVGITPECIEEYLKNCGMNYLYKPSIVISSNLCGGVGKTTSTFNLGLSLRRIISRTKPIVFIDADSQARITKTIFGEHNSEKFPILFDYLTGKNSIDEVLTPCKDNIWIIRANFRQMLIDKYLSTYQDIAEKMFNLYSEIFNKLGPNTYILQDQKPELSNLLASSLCGLYQLPVHIMRCFIIPMRTDVDSIQAADNLIQELRNVKKTFKFDGEINTRCFFSNVDMRVPKIVDGALNAISSRERVREKLSAVRIRYSSSFPSAGLKEEASNIFALRCNRAIEDYRNLMLDIFST